MRALDLGCGQGRNAVHLARSGFAVDAVDLSAGALRVAASRAAAAGVEVRLVHGDAFAADNPLNGPYDLVWDSGCFHHLPPHRRVSHLALLDRVLAPGGVFGLTCFAPGGGSERDDAELYRTGGLHGGLAYEADDLRHVFSGLEEIAIRRMRDEPANSGRFGRSFLWAALFRRPGREPIGPGASPA